jgi:hypothetical protein
MMYALWSSLNHIPIKYTGPIKKTSHLRPIYVRVSFICWQIYWIFFCGGALHSLVMWTSMSKVKLQLLWLVFGKVCQCILPVPMTSHHNIMSGCKEYLKGLRKKTEQQTNAHVPRVIIIWLLLIFSLYVAHGEVTPLTFHNHVR